MNKLIKTTFLLGVIVSITTSSQAFRPESQSKSISKSDKLQKAMVTQHQEQNRRVGISNEDLKVWEQRPIWQNFRAQYGSDWAVDINPKTGIPHRIFGGIIKSATLEKKSASDIIDLATQFIGDHQDLLRITITDLALTNQHQDNSLTRITYQQNYKGLLVQGSLLQLVYTPAGDLIQITNDIYPGISISVDPKLTAKQSIDIVKQQFAKDAGSRESRIVPLVIYPKETQTGYIYHLAYQVEIRTRKPIGRWLGYIDAQTGEIVSIENKVRYDSLAGSAKLFYKPLYDTDSNTQGNAASLQIIYADPTPVYDWNMNSNPSGFTAEGSWQYGAPSGAENDYGNPDPASAYTGTNIYGYNLSGPYENSITTPYYLTTPSLNLSGKSELLLTFYRWLGVEWGYYDHAKLEASPNGSSWSMLWENPTDELIDDSVWSWQIFNISALCGNQANAKLRWAMGPTDNAVNHSGWHLDDIQILRGATGYSEITGAYNFTGFGNSTYMLKAKAKGRYIETFNTIGSSTTLSITVGNSTSSIVQLNTANHVIDEMNVYYHANKLHDYMKFLDPGFTGLDYVMPAYVLLQDEYTGGGYDNAYWDGYSINFGQGSTMFRDLGLFADVVYHEYQHGVTDTFYGSHDVSGAQHEGWSDYWACTMTNESDVGEGGLTIGQPFLRTLDHNLISPDDENGDIYNDGDIFAAAMWEIRTTLGQYMADSIFHNARYGYSDNFNDYLQDIFLQDDAFYGDSNPANSSPHALTIFGKAARHGFGLLAKDYQIVEIHGNGNNRLDPGETVYGALQLFNNAYSLTRVYCIATSSDPRVTMSLDSVNLPSLSVGQYHSCVFSFTLDTSAHAGDTIWFNLKFNSSNGYTITQEFPVVVGSAPIYSFSMDTNPGFSVQGQWQYGHPTGGGGYYSYYTDPVGGFDGYNCYGYNLYGNYTSNIVGTQYLTTPALNLSGFTKSELWFYRWLNIDSWDYDQANIQVSNNGSVWYTIWQNDDYVTDANWVLKKYSLSPYADNQPTVYLRWGLGPTDSSFNLTGWNIDNITIYAIDPVTHIYTYVTEVDRNLWMLFE